MSLAVRVLIALIAGLGAGLLASYAGTGMAAPLADLLQPVGIIWVSAIRMAIIPLVVSSLLLGVGGAPDPRTVGLLGARGLAMFIVMLVMAAVLSLAAAPAAFARLAIDPAAAESLRASAAQSGASVVEGAKQLPSLAQWFIDLVPVNPVKAAADGALLPLIVFTGTRSMNHCADRKSTRLNSSHHAISRMPSSA